MNRPWPAVDAFKNKWAGFLPRAGHLPIHIPLPKDMTIEEVEEIQMRLNAEAGELASCDPVFSLAGRFGRA